MSVPLSSSMRPQGGATSMLQEQYNKDMSLKEGETLALTVLRQVMEEKITNSNIELAICSAATGKFKQFNKAELEEILTRLPAPTLPTLQSAAATSASS